MKPAKWTPETEERLRRAYLDGVPMVELAERFGRTVSSINTKTCRMNIPPRTSIVKTRLDERQKEWLRANYHLVRLSVIKSVLGISVSTIDRIARQMGLKKNGRKHPIR